MSQVPRRPLPQRQHLTAVWGYFRPLPDVLPPKTWPQHLACPTLSAPLPHPLYAAMLPHALAPPSWNTFPNVDSGDAGTAVYNVTAFGDAGIAGDTAGAAETTFAEAHRSITIRVNAHGRLLKCVGDEEEIVIPRALKQGARQTARVFGAGQGLADHLTVPAIFRGGKLRNDSAGAR